MFGSRDTFRLIMSPLNPYKPPDSAVDSQQDSVLRLYMSTAVILLTSMVLAYVSTPSDVALSTISNTIGFVLGQSLLVPIAVTGMFQIFRRFRNHNSRLKTFRFLIVLVVVAQISNVYLPDPK